jgi:hypothetical protein
MPCNPSANTLNPPYVPPIDIPGFGLAISPIQIPVPGFEFPNDFPQTILDFINNLTIPWVGGNFSPNLDDLSNSILKALSNLFTMIAPFLSLYNFFQALLNLIICIIEVICAIANPFALVAAVIKLFKTCIPPFLNLFPWIALIIMILSILLLIIALIEYILARILQLIEALLANLIILANGASLQDAESTAAAAIKIASLLCLIENLMAVFSAIAAIMSIIDALSRLAGFTICGPSSGCCGNDICPPFIRNNPNGITGTLGELLYYREIDPSFPTNFFDRAESWQFYNEDLSAEYIFRDIITPVANENGEFGGIFWPDGISFPSNTVNREAPYNLDLTIKSFDPRFFHPTDLGGPRNFNINKAIVQYKPVIGVYNQANQLDVSTNPNGTLNLIGGLVTEEDGTPYIVNGSQATLQTFIHSPINNSGTAPPTDDGYYIPNIDFTLNINHPALIKYSLITLGCVPEVAAETALINATTDFRSAFDKGGSLPNIPNAQRCVSNAISRIRSDVSIENVSEQAAVIETCLRDLLNETTTSFCSFLKVAVSPFNSIFDISPDLQFVTREIEVKVTLNDANGINVAQKIPDGCDPSQWLEGNVTFGEISEFVFDGYGQFLAYISSDQPGSGELTVSWDNNILSRKVNQDNLNEPTAVEPIVLPYTFVGTVLSDPIPRRGVDDISISEN